MELTGTVKVIFDEKAIKASFRKREMVLTTQDRYPQQILIEFTQDKIGLLDSVNVGDEVKVSINIRGREWTSPRGDVKYFVSVQGWKVEKLAHQSANDSGPVPDAPPDEAPFPDSPDGGDSLRDDDIPF
jgi:hypothetical protein